VHILDATAVLPVQEILANQWLPNSQSIFQEVKKPVQSTKNKRYSGSGFTYLVQDWLNLKLVVEKGLGVPDLYCLYLNPHNDKGHNFKKRDPDEVGMVAKYQGCNPWKESKDGNGDSFCVNQFQGRLPSFVDRFGACEIVNTKTGQIKHGGSLIDYWYLMKNEISGQWVGHSLQDCFAEVVRDICDHFKIEKFDFKDNKHKLEILKYYLSEELKGKLYLCKWQGASGFFAFDSIAQIWSYQANKDSLWINILNPLIKARYGKDVAENASYQKVLANWVFNNWNDEFLLTPKSEDTRYTPFSNGLYDIETKQLVSNDGRAFNLSRFAFDYQPASDDDPDILEFKNYWFEWIGCPVKAEFLLNWIIMNAQRKAGTVKNCIVILIGKKLCGKTFYHGFISKMLGIYGIVPDESFTSANNNHATAQLEGKYHIGLKELNQNMSPTLISRLMVLSGESGQKQMNVNPKGQASREITIQFGITGDAENELKLPSTQDGILRRFNLIKVPPTASRDDLEPARDRMLGNLQKILCWCLQQDFAAVKERFIELSKHDEIAGYTKQTVAESDPIYTFVQECLEVTNEDKDKETTADLYTLFTAWAKTQGLRYVLTKAKFKDLLPQTLYKNFAWYNSESEPPKESTQRCDQKYTKGFKGLLIDKVVRDELIQLSSY
jgi:phage/plasmid-associated DNA primase